MCLPWLWVWLGQCPPTWPGQRDWIHPWRHPPCS